MKVKLCVLREVEIEVDDPSVSELDNYWRTKEAPVTYTPELDSLVVQAVKAVEKVSGIPFGDATAPETISAVTAMDGEPIIEW